MGYTHKEQKPKEKLEREDFFDFLGKNIPLRKEYKRDCDKPLKLDKKEENCIFVI